MSFFPEKYAVPQGSSRYTKFIKGDNRFRILSEPLLGWEWWIDTETDGKAGRKPVRVAMGTKLDPSNMPIKHFQIFTVWNYQTEQIEILEVTQKGIQRTIENLAKDEDWGDPREYDFVVKKEGDGLETEYQTTPKPKKPMLTEVLQELKENPVNLKVLFDNGDPFAKTLDTQLKDDDIEDIMGGI